MFCQSIDKQHTDTLTIKLNFQTATINKQYNRLKLIRLACCANNNYHNVIQFFCLSHKVRCRFVSMSEKRN